MGSAAPSVSSTPEPPPARRSRLSRGQRVGLGLLLTLLGLFLCVAALPSSPGPLLRILPYFGAGLVALWVGGILLGFARGH